MWCMYVLVQSLSEYFCLSLFVRVPLSGCAWRMPSAVWKAWKELGKSTSGSDSSTSWSRDIMASITPIWVWLQPFHSECCRKVRVAALLSQTCLWTPLKKPSGIKGSGLFAVNCMCYGKLLLYADEAHLLCVFVRVTKCVQQTETAVFTCHHSYSKCYIILKGPPC